MSNKYYKFKFKNVVDTENFLEIYKIDCKITNYFYNLKSILFHQLLRNLNYTFISNLNKKIVLYMHLFKVNFFQQIVSQYFDIEAQ